MATQGLARTTSSLWHSLRGTRRLGSPLEALRAQCQLHRNANDTKGRSSATNSRRKGWLLDQTDSSEHSEDSIRGRPGQRAVSSAEGPARARSQRTHTSPRQRIKALLLGTEPTTLQANLQPNHQPTVQHDLQPTAQSSLQPDLKVILTPVTRKGLQSNLQQEVLPPADLPSLNPGPSPQKSTHQGLTARPGTPYPFTQPAQQPNHAQVHQTAALQLALHTPQNPAVQPAQRQVQQPAQKPTVESLDGHVPPADASFNTVFIFRHPSSHKHARTFEDAAAQRAKGDTHAQSPKQAKRYRDALDSKGGSISTILPIKPQQMVTQHATSSLALRHKAKSPSGRTYKVENVQKRGPSKYIADSIPRASRCREKVAFPGDTRSPRLQTMTTKATQVNSKEGTYSAVDTTVKSVEEKQTITNLVVVQVPRGVKTKTKQEHLGVKQTTAMNPHVHSATHTSKQSFRASINITVKKCSTIVSNNCMSTSKLSNYPIKSAPVCRRRNRRNQDVFPIDSSLGACSMMIDQRRPDNASSHKEQTRVECGDNDNYKQPKIGGKTASTNESKRDKLVSRSWIETMPKEFDPRGSKLMSQTYPDLVEMKGISYTLPVINEPSILKRSKLLNGVKSELLHTDARRSKKEKVEEETAKKDSGQSIMKSKSVPVLTAGKPPATNQKCASKPKEKSIHNEKKQEKQIEGKKSKMQDLINRTLGISASKADITEEKSAEATPEKKPSTLELIRSKFRRRGKKTAGKTEYKKSSKTSIEEKNTESKGSNAEGWIKPRRKKKAPKASHASERRASAGKSPSKGGSSDAKSKWPPEDGRGKRKRTKKMSLAQMLDASAGKKRLPKRKFSILSWLPWKNPGSQTCEMKNVELKKFDETVERIAQRMMMDKSGLPPPPCVHKYKNLAASKAARRRAEAKAPDAPCRSPHLTGKPLWAQSCSKEASKASKPTSTKQGARPTSEVPEATMRKRPAPEGATPKGKGVVAVRTKRSTVLLKEGEQPPSPLQPPPPLPSPPPPHPPPRTVSAKKPPRSIPIAIERPPPLPGAPTPPIAPSASPLSPPYIPPSTSSSPSASPRLACRPSAESLLGFGKNFGKVWPPPPGQPPPKGDPCGPRRAERPPPPTPFDHTCVHPLFPSRPIPTRHPPPCSSLEARTDREERHQDALALCSAPPPPVTRSDCVVASRKEAASICVPPSGIRAFSPWRRIFWVFLALFAPLAYWLWGRSKRRRAAAAAAGMPPPCDDTQPQTPCVLPPPVAPTPAPCVACDECKDCPGKKVAEAAAAEAAAAAAAAAAEAPAAAAGDSGSGASPEAPGGAPSSPPGGPPAAAGPPNPPPPPSGAPPPVPVPDDQSKPPSPPASTATPHAGHDTSPPPDPSDLKGRKSNAGPVPEHPSTQQPEATGDQGPKAKAGPEEATPQPPAAPFASVPKKIVGLVPEPAVQSQVHRSQSASSVPEGLKGWARAAASRDAWRGYKRRRAATPAFPDWGSGDEGIESLCPSYACASTQEQDNTYASSLRYSEDEDSKERTEILFSRGSSLLDDDTPVSEIFRTPGNEEIFVIPDIPIWEDLR